MVRTVRVRRASAAVALVLVAVAMAGASRAAAAGDAKLDKYVVTFRAPGWSAWSKADLKVVVDAERQAMKAATTDPLLVAVKGWQNGNNRVFVVLTAFPHGVDAAEKNVRAAVMSTCASAVGESPTNQHAFAGGDVGSEGTCKGTSTSGNDVEGTVISFVQGNTLGLVVGTGATKAQIEALARKQTKALPAGGVLL
jgi:hypothetical protein